MPSTVYSLPASACCLVRRWATNNCCASAFASVVRQNSTPGRAKSTTPTRKWCTKWPNSTRTTLFPRAARSNGRPPINTTTAGNSTSAATSAHTCLPSICSWRVSKPTAAGNSRMPTTGRRKPACSMPMSRTPTHPARALCRSSPTMCSKMPVSSPFRSIPVTNGAQKRAHASTISDSTRAVSIFTAVLTENSTIIIMSPTPSVRMPTSYRDSTC